MNENETPPTIPDNQGRTGFFALRWARLSLTAGLVAGAIFVLDIAFSLGALAGMPYTVLIALGWFAERWYFTFITSAVATLLTVVAHPLSFDMGDPETDLANRAIALVAIWSAALLLIHAKRRTSTSSKNNDNSSLHAKLRETHSELELMRSAQRRLQRLAAMGEKAGTTAHELRNPLGVIVTSMSVIEFKARQVELDLANPVDRAKRAICRCEHIIDEHLDAARAQGHRPESVIIDNWLTALSMEMEFPGDVSLVRELRASSLAIELDVDSFRRVLINLVDNAVQAMAETQRDRILTLGSRVHDEFVEITVADSGPGIAPTCWTMSPKPFSVPSHTARGLVCRRCNASSTSMAGP